LSRAIEQSGGFCSAGEASTPGYWAASDGRQPSTKRRVFRKEISRAAKARRARVSRGRRGAARAAAAPTCSGYGELANQLR